MYPDSGRAIWQLDDRGGTLLYALIKKEWLSHLVSFRFKVCTVLAVVLAVLAAGITADGYQRRWQTYQQRLAEAEAGLRAVHVYSFLQPTVLRPPEPLSVLNQGLEPLLGMAVDVHLFAVPAAAGNEGEPAAALHGVPLHGVSLHGVSLHKFDLSTVVQVVLGLLALLLSFDSFNGERQRGTLLLILANAVDRRTVLAGKYLGALAALLVPLTLSFGLTVAILRLRAGVVPDGALALRLAALFGAYLGYLSLMVLLGQALSVSCRRPATALVIAVLAWSTMVLLVPQAASALAWQEGLVASSTGERQHAAALLAERDRRLAAAWQRDRLRVNPLGNAAPLLETSRHRAVLYRRGSRAFYDALARYYRYETALGMHYAERIFALRQQARQSTAWAVRALVKAWDLCPVTLLDRLASSFTATSEEDNQRFLAACRDYRLRLIAYQRQRQAFHSWRWFTDDREPDPWPGLFQLTPEQVDAGNFEALSSRLGEPQVRQRLLDEQERFRRAPERRLDLADLPRFAGAPLAPREVLARSRADVAWMLALHLLLAGLARWRLKAEELA